MIKFTKMCKMTQKQLKNFMQEYLTSKNYEVVSKDGFLYAKGTVPVLLVAHLDTVHKNLPSEIVQHNTKISSPQGIGGDDRCGVFMIASIVEDTHCSVLLCEDEESGMVGAKKFAETQLIKELDVNYMIEFDRKGSNDAVFYSCGNDDFIDFVIDNTNYRESFGTFSDISALMPASKLCGVNLSCGYYNPHTVQEYVMYDEMLNTISVAKALINEECEKFEYTARKSLYDQYSYYGYTPNKKKCSVVDMIRDDTCLELEVIAKDAYGDEYTVYALGDTKAECWLELFLNNPNLCMNDIEDYSFN
jgi:hypothetical protein